MSFRHTARGALLLALFLGWSTPASATDGHFLHGVGAVNSAMGGAGVAATGDLLGSFYLNPAGIFTEKGSRVALGFEMMKAQRSVASEFGPLSGVTESKAAFVPIPAFGWATSLSENLTFGIGMLGIGGFGVDYPASEIAGQAPANPILGPRPNGFGQVYSNFQFMKISPSLAFKAGEKLQLGVSLNMDWASLAVDPMPAAAPAADSPTSAYYSRATAADGAFGFGFQAGLIYQLSDALALGVSYSSPQWFQDFEYNGVYENPNLPNFQQAREFSFALDVPAVYGAGVSMDLDRLLWNADVRYITYSATAGFDESGMNADGSVKGFGWEDILVLATGVEFGLTDNLALRGGYHFTQNPIPDELSAFNIPAPAIVQHHATLGLGFMFDNLAVDVGYYRAFENDITGPFMTPAGSMDVTNTMMEDSFLLSFGFAPGS